MTTAALPRTVTVCGVRHRVRRRRRVMLDGVEVNGSYSHDESEIQVSSSLDVESAWRVLRHEIAHAAFELTRATDQITAVSDEKSSAEDAEEFVVTNTFAAYDAALRSIGLLRVPGESTR